MSNRTSLAIGRYRSGWILGETFRRAVSTVLVWTMVWSSLPPYTVAQEPQATRTTFVRSIDSSHAPAALQPPAVSAVATGKAGPRRSRIKSSAVTESRGAEVLLAEAQKLSAAASPYGGTSGALQPGAAHLSVDAIKQLGEQFQPPAEKQLQPGTARTPSARQENRAPAEMLMASAAIPGTAFSAGPVTAASDKPLPRSAAGQDNQILRGLLGVPLDRLLLTPVMVPFQTQIAGLAVFVGYADDVRANPNFPVPWQGAPNTTFIGRGPSFDAGAIRLDNNTDSPINIDDVFITVPGWTTSDRRDAQGNGIADLWGSFVIAAHSTVILTQTGEFNFDTSDFGPRGCGDTLANGQSPIPTVKVTINGVATTFNDTGHVLDTGGFDLACRGNESLQWRLIGTAGIENAAGHITLSPPTSVQAVGVTYTATAQVTDASNSPTPNVVVNFVVLSGPNTGKTGTGTTDSQGNATFSYSSALLGTDILQASVTNATGGSIHSEQVTTTWTSADPCPTPAQPPDATQTAIVNAGPSSGEFSDPLTLAAQLTDGNGVPLSGRSLSFTFGSQTLQAATDGNGVASVSIAAAPAPGPTPLNVSFAGETNFKPAQLNTTINIDRDETSIRYTGSALLGTVVPQQVSAVLTDGQSGVPIANETVTFRVGTVQAQAVTNAQGVAIATMVLGADQTSGPTAIQVSFAGDSFYKPSVTGVAVTVYLSTSFVIWGGNQGGVHLGQDVNFWGAQWEAQVTGGNFAANPSFKGFADPVNQVHVCEAGQLLDDQCWRSKPGQSFPPPLTVPAYIEVIISTAVTKQGSEIFGNIAAAAVCKVDPTPVYGPDPGKPGFCTLVAVVEDGAHVFPQPPALTATQTQPATVLPGQNFNVVATINNSSPAPASSVRVNESFDGPTPPTATQTFNSILNGAQQTATFQVTSPAVPIRQSNETSLAYQQRLAGIDGRVFTSTGTITFSDSFGQQFLPITVSSSSRLQLPELTVGISGPSCVGPGSRIPYKITVGNIGTAVAQNVSILLNFPDGSNASATIASIPVGGSVTSTINFVVPAISSRQGNETDQQYLARLGSIDGSSLIAVAKVNWQDALGNNYGQIEQKIISTIERVPILTVTPQGPVTILPGQKVTLNLTVQNIGGGNSSQASLQVTNPDGSIINIPAFALQGGQATSVSTTFTVPAAAKRAGESDADYQARLAALDNSSLKFTTQLRWLDAAANNYGPTSGSFQTTEILPVLTVSLTGPATTFSTNNINYNLRIANIGHADASSFTVQVRLPDGSSVNPFPASVLLAGSAAQISIPFGIPRTQPTGQMSAVASMNWTDAAANAYGPQSATVLTANTHLDFPLVSAGPDQSITINSTTLNGSVTDNQLPPGGVLVSSWKALSGPAPVTFSNPSSPVTQITFTANGTYVVQLTGSVANTSLPLAASANATIVVNAPTGGGGGGGGGSVITSVLQGAIGQPLAGTVVQGQTPITVAAGTTLTSGVLDFWPTSNPNNVQVLNGNVTGTGTIGTFDGTTLANGEYIVRLTATDSNGTTQASLITLSVIGENKPGRFTKTVTDLRVPVAGLRITINRTYDSLQRGQVEDFGFGWKLGASVEVSVDSSNNVTFTFNGQRETFFFKPLAGPFPFTFLLTPNYLPQVGVHGTLTSDGCGLLIAQGGFTCFLDGPYQPTTFTYTDPYGRVYVFGADGQMKSAKDLNGSTLTFSASGISSSAGGITVGFVRDGQGRIIQITDPDGNSRNYTYDNAGNLAAVNKPGLASPVTYGYTGDHFLIKETDPRGNFSSSTFFPNGRLQSVTDALGNTTQYAYDLTTNTITTTNPDGGVISQTNNSFGKPLSITDPLNRTTTFTYDAQQNMLTHTNGLGKTTTFTYDANGNATSTTDPLGNKITKTYDNIGRLAQITDPLGQVMQAQHDTHGNLTGISDSLGALKSLVVDGKGNTTADTIPSGATAQFTYDTFGNPVSVTDHLGFSSTRQYDLMGRWTGSSDSKHGSLSFQYDALGNRTQFKDPLGFTLAYSYDADGNRIGETDHNGNHYTLEYDAANHRTRKTYPDGSAYTQTYDFAGRVLTSTNQSGQVTRRVYDKAGQLKQVIVGDGTPDAVNLNYSYDAVGRPTTLTDGRGNATTISYDDADRVTSVTDALGRATSFTYDADGRVTSLTRPNGTKRQITYDVRNRPTSVTNADGTTVQAQYDGLTLRSRTDEAGKTTSYTYNGGAEIASVTDALGNTTQYTRDALGNLTGVTDANGHTTGYQFDSDDRLVKKTLPDGSFEQYTYDGNDNLIAIRLTDGHVNHYSYDDMNRLAQISYFDGQVVSFTYTLTSRRKSATTSGGTTRYDYDGADRLIKITQPNGQAVNYTYDGANNITSISSPAGLIRYSYDVLNRLATVTDPRGGVSTYTYDLAGRLAQRNLPNGVITKYTYDSRDRITGVSHQLGTAAPFESFQYTLSASGKRLSVVEADGTQTKWTYDDDNRLVRETVTKSSGVVSSDTAYSYDPVGNRAAVTVNGKTTTFQYNLLDQLIKAGTAQYSYDTRGNLVQITDISGTTTYGYDAANRLTSLAQPGTGNSASYSYEADGFLASRTAGGTVRNYVWDEISPYGDILYESDGAGVPQAGYTLAHGNLIQQIANGNSTASYYLHDGLGSVIGLTDPSGAQTDRYRFDAYGQQTLFTGTSVNPYRYRSQRTDDVSNLLYLRARYLSPAIGRFLSRDVARFELDDPVDLNRYTYAADNPINDYDPTGNADAVEYGLIARRSAEDATIEGYIVGREDESLISCVGEMLFSVLTEAVKTLGGIWEFLPNKITVAAGHVVLNGLDVKYGPDQVLLAAAERSDTARKALLAKAAEFEASAREDIVAISGRYVPRDFRAKFGNWEIFFFADNGANAVGPNADNCQNHAERKVIALSGAPTASILESVGASRPVCLSCAAALIEAQVRCFGPLGTRVCGP